MKVIFNGSAIEVNSIQEANAIAEQAGLDLVEVAPDTYKVMDFGKYQYEIKKKSKRAAQSMQECKEMQFSLSIAQADLDRKINDVCRWLSEGKNVRVTMRLRGRMALKDSIILTLFRQITDAASERNLLAERPALKKSDSEGYRRDLSMLLKTNVHTKQKGVEPDGRKN